MNETQMLARIAELEAENKRLINARLGSKIRVPNHLGGTIRFERIKRGLSMVAMCKKIGAWTNGRVGTTASLIELRGTMNTTTLAKIAAAFDLKPSELLRIHEERMEALDNQPNK